MRSTLSLKYFRESNNYTQNTMDSQRNGKASISFSGSFILLATLLGLNLFSISCKKFVQIEGPKDEVTTTTVFSDSADATSAVIGLYILAGNSSTSPLFLNGALTLYTGLSSDELSPNTAASSDLQFYTNSLTSQGASNGFWTAGYKLIYQANACIEGLNSSSALDSGLKNQLLGEALSMRALVYFDMVNLYGPIPLVTTTDFNVNATLPRKSTDSIYQRITADLVVAEKLLLPSYPSDGQARFNQYAATALLAKVYLFTKQWANAEAASTILINLPSYSLEANLNNVFLTGSTEAILQLLPSQAGFETFDGYIFVPGAAGVIPSYTISTYLLNAFEANDQRQFSWIAPDTVNGQVYYFPYKMKLGEDNNSSPAEAYMLLRLGEQYLIRAEARAQQNSNLMGAVGDLNTIRFRAGLQATTATSQSQILSAVQHERQVELLCEGGNRWFDLKRTNQVNQILGTDGVCAFKGGAWSSNWQLYPIPFDQLQANPFLTQNIGY